MSSKPRHPPEVPGGGTEIIRELHGKIQEGNELAKKLRDLIGEARAATDRLNATADQVREKASEDAVKTMIEPTIDMVVNRIIEVGDTARDVLIEREQQLTAIMTKAAGLKSPEELVKMIADMISFEVTEAVMSIRKDREDQEAAVDRLVSLVPDFTTLLGGPVISDKPVPPKVKKQQPRRSHSRNQGRRL